MIDRFISNINLKVIVQFSQSTVYKALYYRLHCSWNYVLIDLANTSSLPVFCYG